MGYRSVVSRWLPSSDLLNLTFGLSAGVAINLLTAGAIGGLNAEVTRRVHVGGWAFLVASVLVGILAVMLSRAQVEALEGVGATLSVDERRAQVLASLEAMAVKLAVIGLAAVLSFAVGIIGLTL